MQGIVNAILAVHGTSWRWMRKLGTWWTIGVLMMLWLFTLNVFGFSWFLVTRCCWLVVTGALQDALVCTCRFALWLAFPAFQRELYFWIVSQSLIDVISYMSRRTNSSPGDLLLRVTTSPKLWRIATLLPVASAKQGVFFYILFTIKYLNTGFFLPIISNLVGSLWNESSFQSYPSNLLFCFFEHPLYSA